MKTRFIIVKAWSLSKFMERMNEIGRYEDVLEVTAFNSLFWMALVKVKA
jgi:hypothetical protein